MRSGYAIRLELAKGVLLIVTALGLGTLGIDASFPPLRATTLAFAGAIVLAWATYAATFCFLTGRLLPLKEGKRSEVTVRATICGADASLKLLYWPLYHDRWRNGGCVIEAIAPDGTRYHAISHNYFAALLELRKQLEGAGILVQCWGAKLDVWPTGMEADMGAGLTARQRSETLQAVGEQSLAWGIFEALASGETGASAADQEALFRARFDKLKSASGARPPTS